MLLRLWQQCYPALAFIALSLLWAQVPALVTAELRRSGTIELVPFGIAFGAVAVVCAAYGQWSENHP